MKNIKPIYKFNSGMGATLCGNCRVIIKTGTPIDCYLCEKCLKNHAIVRHIATWGTWFNKYGVARKHVVTNYLNELTDNHLINIFKYMDDRGNLTPTNINNEILYRKQYPEYSIKENKSYITRNIIAPIVRYFGKRMGRQTTNII